MFFFFRIYFKSDIFFLFRFQLTQYQWNPYDCGWFVWSHVIEARTKSARTSSAYGVRLSLFSSFFHFLTDIELKKICCWLFERTTKIRISFYLSKKKKMFSLHFTGISLMSCKDYSLHYKTSQTVYKHRWHFFRPTLRKQKECTFYLNYDLISRNFGLSIGRHKQTCNMLTV